MEQGSVAFSFKGAKAVLRCNGRLQLWRSRLLRQTKLNAAIKIFLPPANYLTL